MRVVAIYAVTAWLVLQIAEVTFEPLGFPDWALRTLIVAAITGFPVSFLLAWIVDAQPDGLKFDLPLWIGDEDSPRQQKKSDLVYAALLALLLAGSTYSAITLLIDNNVNNPAHFADTSAPANSIAVLAFRNFGGLNDSDYFASGLGEEILNLLAGMQELNVAARTSSFRFRNDEMDIREIAELLSVRYVLEGSVRQAEDQIRVTAQLIDGSSGYHSWSKIYERPLTDIFSIQEEIAAAVVNELQIALSVSSEARLQIKPTDDVDAYIYYLQGQDRLRDSNDSDVMGTATQLFRNAIEIDPEFARAYAGICEAALRLYEISREVSEFERAQAACDEAADRNKGLNSEVYLALGRLYRFRGADWFELAEAELKKGIAVTPTAADLFIELGEVYAANNILDKAEASFLRAIDLKRNYWKAHEALAGFFYDFGRYEEAAEYYEIASSLAPDVASVIAGKGAAYTMLGDIEKARLANDRSEELKPSRQVYTNVGLDFYYAGEFDRAVEMQLKALDLARNDHRVWGRLAESYRFIPGSEPESQNAYQEAAKYAKENLAINESDWRTRGMLGLYLAHLEQFDEAFREVDRSVSDSKRSAEALYYQALAYLQSGNQDGALDALEEAVATDTSYRLFIASDPDLQSLDGNDRFSRLLMTDE